ncbi:MAG: discoidin domain-containing protein [Phycisphaerae bacterium]
MTRPGVLFAMVALGGAICLIGPAPAAADIYNVKVVTDGNPDYTDIGSMIWSITSNWPETKDKCWAMWYWTHIARRQTRPMDLHGHELTDPVRQFNDYGYTMCSTIAGTNCAIWGAMGLNVKFWDISLHTVPEVEYDGKYHMYDNSLSAIYTLCDGKTVAGVVDIGADGACEKSGGKTEPGHIAKYHCLNSTSDNGYLTGCDTIRGMAEEYKCFNPRGLKYREYLNNWDLGYRYILNLRDNEVYTRYYRRLDANSPKAVQQSEKGGGYKADPAYYTPNPAPGGKDPESANPRYHIRGNGVRVWEPSLTNLAASAYSATGVSAVPVVHPAEAGKAGEVIFKVEGANVITSLVIKPQIVCKTADDSVAVSISTTNGLAWQDVWKGDSKTDGPQEIGLIGEVNGSYEVLVKVTLNAKASPSDAQLKAIRFETITQINSKTQPRLRLGRNTVYVGAGEQTESTVFWPDLRAENYKQYVVEESNVKAETAAVYEKNSYMGVIHPAQAGEDGYIVFRMDAPSDITRITYGGRFYNRAQKAHIDMLHSFDGGKTWKTSYSLTDTTSPWDVIHYEKATDVPTGTKSVLFKYLMSGGDKMSQCSIYAVHMEANYKPADTTPKPMEVTFTWKEVQEDYSTVTRSHTQLVEKPGTKYTIDVGGVDHPVMESLQVNLKGAVEATTTQPAVKYGYSDGKEIPDARKFQERWVTVGKVLSEGKPYTCTEKSGNNWGAGDPDGKKLTCGVVGPPHVGGVAYATGVVYEKNQKPEITVDLGKAESCGAFRIQLHGYPFLDAIKGQVKDKVEVLTSSDGQNFASQGFFNTNLRWKDIPVNFMWNDDETFTGHNFELVLPKPVEARYVKFKITNNRGILATSQVQVLDFIKYDPFDLKLALPDGKDRSDITAYPMPHKPSQRYRPNAQQKDNAGGGN